MRLRIRELRRARGESQEELAEALGTTQATISRYETGQQWPTVATIERIAAHFSVRPEEMLAGLKVDTDTLDPETARFLLIYRSLPKQDQDHLAAIAESLSRASDKAGTR